MKPSEEYTIHVLEDADFDMLPVGKPKEALGMTDAKRKTAWVRRTHVRDLDMGTIRHEFDELMSKDSLHEVDGIRYKGGLIPFIGNIIAAIAGSFAVEQGVKGLGRATGLTGKAGGAQQAAPQQKQIQSAFAPQNASPGPLSGADFSKGLGDIDKNLTSRLGSLGSLFRGQAEPQNSAFKTQADAARLSATKSRDDFTKQQDEAKRIAGVF